MSDDMDTADVLDAAADKIRIFGLNKGDYGHEFGRQCALGAIATAMQDFAFAADSSPAAHALRRVIGKSSISEWNDKPRRTAPEVIDSLMEAAARVRLGEIK